MNTANQGQKPTQYANNRKGYMNWQLLALFGSAEALVINLMLYKLQNDPHILDTLNEVETTKYGWQEIGYGEFSANYGLHQKSIARAIKALVTQGYLLKGATSQNGTLYRLNMRKLIADMEIHCPPLALGDLAITKDVAEKLSTKFPRNQITHEMLLGMFGMSTNVKADNTAETPTSENKPNPELLNTPEVKPEPKAEAPTVKAAPVSVKQNSLLAPNSKPDHYKDMPFEDYIAYIGQVLGTKYTEDDFKKARNALYAEYFPKAAKTHSANYVQWNGWNRALFITVLYMTAKDGKPCLLPDITIETWKKSSAYVFYD